MDHAETSLVFDNRKMHNILQDNLWIKQPNCCRMNSLITKIISSFGLYELRVFADINNLCVFLAK